MINKAKENHAKYIVTIAAIAISISLIFVISHMMTGSFISKLVPVYELMNQTVYLRVLIHHEFLVYK